MDGIATHLEATVAVALETGRLWPNSMILELGCGDYSTPLLHRIAMYQNRPMLNIVSDFSWAKRFQHLIGPRHYFKYISLQEGGWPEFPVPDGVGMALMDNEQETVFRFENIKRMAKVGVVVAHDAKHTEDRGCRWIDMKALYQHVIIIRRRYPETPGTDEMADVAVLSNVIDPAQFFHPGSVEVVA